MCKKKETHRFYSNLSLKNADKKNPFPHLLKLQIQKGTNCFYRKQQEIISLG